MANKQQIQLVTKKFTDRLSDPDNPRDMYVAALRKHAIIVGDKLIQNICNHSNQKFAQVVTILTALPNAIADYLAAGHAVQIKDLCTLKPKMRVSAKDTAAECTVDTIKSVGVSAQPIGKTKELVKNWKFIMLKKIVDMTGAAPTGSGAAAGSASTDKVNVVFLFIGGRQQILTGVPGTPLTAPANSAEGMRWTPKVPAVFPKNSRAFREVDETDARIWVSFEFADGTVHEEMGFEGDPLTAPQNTAGYHWPADVPATFPSANVKFTEIADGAPATKYTLTLQFNGGRQETAQYAEGETITYPANTQDYVWPWNKPTTMPAQDTTVTEELDPNLDPGV